MRPLQGGVCFGIGCGDFGLDDIRAVNHQHHFTHKDVTLAVHQVVTEFSEREGLLRVD